MFGKDFMGMFTLWSQPFDYIGLALNFIAAAILACALFPPYLDTKKSRKTYGLSDSFFLFYVMGNGCMIVNALLNILSNVSNTAKIKENITTLILFTIFLCINSLSIYLNLYILKIKRENMRESLARGISEQEYWEKYLAPGQSKPE